MNILAAYVMFIVSSGSMEKIPFETRDLCIRAIPAVTASRVNNNPINAVCLKVAE